MTIPFIDLKTQYHALRDQVQERINGVLEHGQYIMGPEVEELESKLAAYTGVKHCITVASGTEALLISLMALDFKPGDEVITTPFTFAATAEVIVLLGGKPVFVDIESDTCNIDPRLIEAKITPRTRAIIPVSLYGQPADMDEINAIAARHGNIPVIEDAAQSFGADYRGRIAATSALSAAPASSPASHWAAMATAAPSSPVTTLWHRPCARSACTGSPSATYTPALVSAAVWTPCSAQWCWPSSSALTGRSSSA